MENTLVENNAVGTCGQDYFHSLELCVYNKKKMKMIAERKSNMKYEKAVEFLKD
jgi:hypothetical protein